MLAQIFSAGVLGIEAYPVEIEVDVQDGLPQEVVVGLPDAAVKESKDRVHAALLNSGFRYPDDRITINLAPADIKKEGPSFDLPIALGMLKASSQLVREDLSGFLAVGELALNGAIRPVKGILSIALMAKEKGGKSLLVPAANGPEAAIVEGLEVRGVESLSQVIQFLEGRLELNPVQVNREELFRSSSAYEIDFADVKGQEHVKRAIDIALSQWGGKKAA